MDVRSLSLLFLLVVACRCDSSDSADSGDSAAPTSSTSSTSSAASGATTGAGGTSTTTSSSAAGGQSDPCKECKAPTTMGDVADVVDEASGLAASRVHPGAYYVHNDSGDSPRFFAIDESGADKGTYNVMSATAVDWEDMAVGPCPAGSCLYLGDVGDNAQQRSSYVIYRVAEPTSLQPGNHNITAESLEFVYPDGSHNCETVLAHPTTGELFVVTKNIAGPSGVYRFPKIEPGSSVVLEKVGEVTPPEGNKYITAGDIHPLGFGVLLRTYSHLFFYKLSGSVSQALAGQPCSVPVAKEGQGETIAWRPDGSAYVTVSEGAGSEIYVSSCAR